jgi:hypothetical protein
MPSKDGLRFCGELTRRDLLIVSSAKILSPESKFEAVSPCRQQIEGSFPNPTGNTLP